MNEKRLYKSRTDRKICGVCGGFAEYLNMDPTVVRIIVLILMLCAGLSLWVYIIAAIIMPDEPEYRNDDYINGN